MSVVYDSSFTPQKVYQIVNDKEALHNFIGKEYELVATHRTCSKCNIYMKWQCVYTWKRCTKDVKSVEHTYGFRCSKCHAVKPYRHKSVFAGSHLAVGKCIVLMYYWFTKEPQEKCVHDLGIDKETVRAWYLKCRTVCQAKLLLDDSLPDMADGLMGGEGKTVEVDETCLGKLKYHRGLRKAAQVWVLGAVERSSAGDSGFKFRCSIVSDRSEATMVPFLNKWIRPDTEPKRKKSKGLAATNEYLKQENKTLVDLLRASETPWYMKVKKQSLCMYQATVAAVTSFFDRHSWCKESLPPAAVTQLGKKYKKRTVDHSYTFKNKVTGACTNTIEGRWRHMKANLPSNGTRRTMLPSYLCEHMYRCAYASRDKKYDFGTFLKHVAQVYNPYSSTTASPPALVDTQEVPVPASVVVI